MLVDPDTEKDTFDSTGDSRKLDGHDGLNQRELDRVLDRHRNVLSADPGLTNLTGMEIKTRGTEPITQHPYKPPDRLLDSVVEEIQSLKKKGIIEPSASLWASPIIPVPKSNG